MKKITFKVRVPKAEKLVDLTKEMERVACKIELDFKNSLIIVEAFDDIENETIIKLINKYYIVLNIFIDEQIEGDNETGSGKTVKTSVGDDIIEETIEFPNKIIEKYISRLLKTTYWALFHRKAPVEEIEKLYESMINEMGDRYKRRTEKFYIGDIVKCNLGNGFFYIPAIVCDILEPNLVYVVPIFNNAGGKNVTSVGIEKISIPQDTIYYNETWKPAKATLYMGKYIPAYSIEKVIGKTKPEVFGNLVKKLATMFDFTENVAQYGKGFYGYSNKNFKKAEKLQISQKQEASEEKKGRFG